MSRIDHDISPLLSHARIAGLALAILCICFVDSRAQSAKAQGINPDSLSFLRIGVSQGLSQSFINCILQDRYGFMWFGTQDGLNFYDGYSFTHYRHDPRDPQSLPSNIILCMVEDQNGHFYVGTTGGGLCYFDRKTFVPIPLPRSQPRDIYDSHISALYIDSSGMIWIGTRGRQLFRYDPKTKSVTTYTVPQNGKLSTPVYVRDIMEDSQNRLWVALDLGGVAIVDRSTGVFHRLTLPGEFRKRSRLLNVLSIAQDWYGNIILGTHVDGLLLLHPDGSYSHYLTSRVVHCVVPDPFRKKIWVGIEGEGANLYDPRTGAMVKFQYDPDNPRSVSSPTVKCVFVGPHGETWLGTTGGGLNLAYPRLAKFHLMSISQRGPQRLTFASVRSILETPDGAVWLGGYRGLNVLTRTPRKAVVHVNSDFVPYCMIPCPGVPDALIIGTEGSGLMAYNWKVRRPIPLPGVWKAIQRVIPLDSRAFSILIDRDSTAWIGTQHGLFECHLRNGKVYQHRHSEVDSTSVPQGALRAMFQDKDGTLWFGSELGGLILRRRGSNAWSRPPRYEAMEELLKDNSLNMITRDKKGVYWLGSSNGLIKLDYANNTFRNYTTEHGLPNNVVYSVIEDRKGFLWLSTNKGICRFSPSTEIYRIFDVVDGLQNNEFNVRSYFHSPSGEIFMGGIGGVTHFYPDEILFNEDPPPVVFTALRVFNKNRDLPFPIYQMREIHLRHTDNVFTIDVAALNYYLPERNQYAYMLEGLHNEWVPLGPHRSITFANLAPGTYTLHVKGSNNDFRWNETGASIRLVVIPAFWQTLWFRILFVIVGGLLLGTLIYQRLRRMKAMNTKLEVLVRERTKDLEASEQRLRQSNATREKLLSIVAHDLRSPFSALLGFSEILDQDYDSVSDTERRHLMMNLHATMKKTYDLIENVLSWATNQLHEISLHPESLSVLHLVQHALATVDILIRQKNISCTVSISSDLNVYADEDTLNSILRNLISNALKFSYTGGQISVGGTQQGDRIFITIADSGIGLSTEQINNILNANPQSTRGTQNEKGTGLGLQICLDLAERNGGSIEIHSVPGAGTTMTVDLPARPPTSDGFAPHPSAK